MTTESAQPAFEAFQQQLRTLCLNEFPCGLGSWRENFRRRRRSIQRSRVASEFSVTLKDYGAQHEKTENLDELITSKKSPWNMDYSWSQEAKGLREIAVKSPWLIDEKFILAYFRTLRIVDKGVTEVDENFLAFPNLEELTLSANKLKTVKSVNLPQSLRVLELCANEIYHLEDLCVRPPPLIHLGLGHNLLTFLGDYITGHYWPYLLSLDLSHNNLSDLMEVVRKLQTLPKLRNVLLQGNPLSLVPGYRGYVIDSLRNLDFLDDISISADEKHHYKGLAKRKEYILDEAKVLLQVDYIKGVTQPEELKCPEDQPEFPIITRNYYVQFMFLEDTSSKAEVLQLLNDTEEDVTRVSTSQTSQIDDKQNAEKVEEVEQGSRAVSVISNVQQSQGGTIGEKNVNFVQEADTARSQSIASESQVDIQDVNSLRRTPNSVEEALKLDNTEVPLAPLRSASSMWHEEMEIKWEEMVVRDDLLLLRNFFKQGMDIAVMEEKILSYPADQVQDGMLSPAGGKDKGKADKKDKKDDKKKDDPKKARTGKKQSTPQLKDDGKKKKKKGEPDVELTHMPAEYTTLAEFHIPLDEFLEGEFVFENVFVKNWHEVCGAHTPTSEMSISSKDKKKKSDKKKDGKEKEKDSHKSPKADRRASIKPKDKGKGTAEPAGDEEGVPPPPPLEVHVKVKLHHWKTAMDSIREEEEAQAAAASADQ